MGRRLATAAATLLLPTLVVVWKGTTPRPAREPLVVPGDGRELVAVPPRPDAVPSAVDPDLRLVVFVATREDLVRRLVRPLGLPWGITEREILTVDLVEKD